jgi:plasmid rolling circle replication initiator protein Rep
MTTNRGKPNEHIDPKQVLSSEKKRVTANDHSDGAEKSYGIIPPAPRDTDVVYILSYDKQKGYLLLNGFVIKSFQWESHADKIFSELFTKKKILTRTVDVYSPAKADVIIRNIGLPNKRVETSLNPVFIVVQKKKTLCFWIFLCYDLFARQNIKKNILQGVFYMKNNNIKKNKKQDRIEENKAKKIKNMKFLNIIKGKVGDTMLEIIENCSKFMMFYADESKEKLKLMKSNSCKNRFCPMCSWRKAKKDALKNSILMKKLIADNQYAFLFLTLTAPNVPGEELEKEIKDYVVAFKRLTKLKEFQKINIGYIRKLEVTYNKEKNTYHPHYHILLCVKKNYFTSRDYIKQKKWLEMWQQAKRDKTITQVDIRKIELNKEDKSFLEISKYTAKDSDYLQSQEVFNVFYDSLKGKQVITYNRIFKDLAKKYDNGELDYLKDIDKTDYIYKLIYEWLGNEYKEILLQKLTEEEKNKMKNI